MSKEDGTVYYRKSFKVLDAPKRQAVPDDYFDFEFDGGSIRTGNAQKLILNASNFLYFANWQCVPFEFEIRVENANNVGYQNGILEIVPTQKGKVKITITEKDTGYLVTSSEFVVS